LASLEKQEYNLPLRSGTVMNKVTHCGNIREDRARHCASDQGDTLPGCKSTCESSLSGAVRGPLGGMGPASHFARGNNVGSSFRQRAIDVSEGRLQQAKEKNARILGVQFVCGDAPYDLQFQSNSFDLVYCRSAAIPEGKGEVQCRNGASLQDGGPFWCRTLDGQLCGTTGRRLRSTNA